MGRKIDYMDLSGMDLKLQDRFLSFYKRGQSYGYGHQEIISIWNDKFVNDPAEYIFNDHKSNSTDSFID